MADTYFADAVIEALFRSSREIVFDMNGLILDDEPLQMAAARETLAGFGIVVDDATWTRRFFGHRSADYFAALLQEHAIDATEERVQAMVADKDRRYRAMLHPGVRAHIFPGVLGLIDHLHSTGGRELALATAASAEEVEMVIGVAGLNLRKIFGVIVCGSDVVKAKPDPDIYLEVARRLPGPPSATLVLEDTAIGVEAASLAGMRSIAVPNRFTRHQNFYTAELVISDLTPEARIIQAH